MLITMLIRAGMELGQVLSEEQRKERFSSCLRRKRAAQEVIIDDYDYDDDQVLTNKDKTMLRRN